jgi:hypothetical protein
MKLSGMYISMKVHAYSCKQYLYEWMIYDHLYGGNAGRVWDAWGIHNIVLSFMGFLYTLSKVFHFQQGKATIGGEKKIFVRKHCYVFKCAHSLAWSSAQFWLHVIRKENLERITVQSESHRFYYFADSDVKSNTLQSLGCTRKCTV